MKCQIGELWASDKRKMTGEKVVMNYNPRALRHDRSWKRRALSIALLDVLCIAVSFFLALLVRFDFRFQLIEPQYIEN